MKGRGQNIPLVTDTGSGLYKNAFFQSSILHAFVQIAQLQKMEQATHMGEGLVQPHFDEVKGVFN